MRTLLFLFFVIFVGSAGGQSIAFTAAVPHTNGTPSGAPSTYGSRLRLDKNNKVLYQWSGSAWVRVPDITTVAQLVSDSLASASGGGLYGGSGTIPDGTWASMAGDFAFRLSPGDDWGVQSTTANDFALRITSDATTLSGLDAGEPSTTLSLGAASVQLSGAPLNYVTDQSGSYTDRSLVDKAYVVAQNATNANLTGPVTSVGNATTIAADAVGASQIAADAVGSSEIAASAVGASEITSNAVDSTKVAASGLSPSDIGPSGASIGQVMTYTSNGWRPAAAGPSYLVYTALLTQSGTSAPVATVLENTLGGTVVWTRSSAGVYAATLAGGFTSDKTWWSPRNSGSAPSGFWLELSWQDADTMSLLTLDGMTLSDDAMLTTPIEIRVYP